MKLISLYIENFGCLSRFSLNFEAGLTTINEPNGFGKTTFAEFIRAMLYGFPRKSKSLEKNPRQKYAPWGGGMYGGNLVFSHEGRTFRLERTFGATPKEDTFALIDLAGNRKTNRFSPEIGTELFGLDSDSFERSVYLPQLQGDGILSTAAIQAKLSDLVEDSGDVVSCDKAIAALRVGRTALIPYRGSGGTVAEATEAISRLQLQLDQMCLRESKLSQTLEAAKQIQTRIDDCQTDLKNVRKRIQAASDTAAAAVQQRLYENLLAQKQQIDRQISEYGRLFPAGIPDMQALQEAGSAAERLATLSAQSADREDLSFPDMREIAEYRKKWNEYDVLQEKLQNLHFAAEKVLQNEELYLHGNRGAWAETVAWLIGTLGLTAGVVMLLLREMLYGIAGLSVGTAATVIAIVLMTIRNGRQRSRQREREERIEAVHQEMAALRCGSEQYLREIGLFLRPFYPNAERGQYAACLTRLEQETLRAAEAQKKKKEADDCKKKLEGFLTRYGLSMEQNVCLQMRRLQENLGELQTAMAQKQVLVRQIAELREEAGDALSAEIPDSVHMRQLRSEELQLQASITELTERLMQLRQDAQLLQADAERIGPLQGELSRWKKKRAEDLEKVRILDDTMVFLQLARENLATSYLDTIRSRFDYYLAQLDSCGETHLIDSNLQVQPERMGKARELAYFSAGQKDLIMLCMRLALVDALFKGQEVFVILDDPFVNLDDKHTAQAKKLLTVLSCERQILYLTCHSSRTI